MAWNWQQPDWPDFTYDPAVLEPLERQFLIDSGEFIGAFRHIGEGDRETLRIDLIGDEALKTSAIEDEVLDRESVQVFASPAIRAQRRRAARAAGRARHRAGHGRPVHELRRAPDL